MIKRYPFQGGNWLKKANIMYFFFAWNAFALCAYEWYTKSQPKDPEWEKLNNTQKFLRMTNISAPGGVVVKRYSGFKKVEEKEMTMEEMLKPIEKDDKPVEK